LPKNPKEKYLIIEYTLGELAKGGQGKIPESKWQFPDIVKLIKTGKKPFTPKAEKKHYRLPVP
jgi:hypothetical protein